MRFLSLDPAMGRSSIPARLALLLGIWLLAGLAWWPLPWGTLGPLGGASLLLCAIAWWRGVPLGLWTGGAVVALDLATLTLLVGSTGGTASPFGALAYIWVFGAVVLHLRQTGGRALPLFALLALLALALGSWGTPGWAGHVVFHALGMGLTVAVGLPLVSERARNLLDPLTAVLHRRAGLELLSAKMRQGRPFTLAFVDLKGFKQINDRHGHGVGDEVLRAVAGRLAGAVRKGDVTMRYGGDEFVVASDLLALRPRLEVVFMAPMRTSAGQITVQADIGEVKWLPGETLEEVLAQADASMYRKKHQNRVPSTEPKTTHGSLG